jgi:hypothetical protein
MIDVSTDNKLQLSASGQGHLLLTFRQSMSDKAWNATLPTFVTLKVPVQLQNQQLQISLANTDTHTLFPRTPSPITDFNSDGQRVYASDNQSFLDAYTAGSMRADVDHSGVLTSEDIAMWQRWFARDTD